MNKRQEEARSNALDRLRAKRAAQNEYQSPRIGRYQPTFWEEFVIGLIVVVMLPATVGVVLWLLV